MKQESLQSEFSPPVDSLNRSGFTPSERLLGLVQSARPRHWIKNLACLAGLIFSENLLHAHAILRAGLSFLGFCLVASSIYMINDVFDRERDRRNPRTRDRAIARGATPVSWALTTAAFLAIAGLASSLAIVADQPTRRLPWLCPAILSAYFLMNLAYSARLKHTVLLDVVIIALGFVFRVLHGVFAVGVKPTRYIALCMFFLALFLGFSKRRGELTRREAAEIDRRPVLGKYTVEFLDALIPMTAGMAILFYSLYTVAGHFSNTNMVVTVPLVFYGVTRYMLLVLSHGAGEAPENEVMADRLLLLTLIAWVLVCIVLIHAKPPSIFDQ